MLRCNQCNGAKYYAAMGGMRVKCNICNGLGFITKNEFTKVEPEIIENVVIKRRRKRNIVDGQQTKEC